MDNFQIETAQNITIAQNVAGLGERILAYIIDALIIVSYAVLISVIMGSLEMSQGEEWVFLLVIGLPIFLYFLVWESLWNGQTPGKAALKLRVVKIDGSKPAFSNYVVRWLLRMIDITFTSGSVAVVTILFNGKGQRLGDLAANTTVISEKAKVSLHNTVLVDIQEGYLPKYPQVTVLSDKDIQDIKNLYQNSIRNRNYKVIGSLSDKVSEIMQVIPEEKPIDFLKTVVKDYNYYTQR